LLSTVVLDVYWETCEKGQLNLTDILRAFTDMGLADRITEVVYGRKVILV